MGDDVTWVGWVGVWVEWVARWVGGCVGGWIFELEFEQISMLMVSILFLFLYK